MMKSLGLAVVALVMTGLAGAAQAQSKGTFTLGMQVPASIVNVPMLMTVERMQAAGYETKIAEFQSPETMSLALENGEVDMVGTSVGTIFAAIEAGLDAVMVLGLAKSDFQMVALAELASCAQLEGRKLAIHSYEGTTGSMTTAWLERECPDARPNIMIVPGSENRLAGLLTGQLEASPIDSLSAAQLMAERPGQFGFIDSFADNDLLASGYIARKAWIAENEETMAELGRIYVDIIGEFTADPQKLIDETKARITEVDPEVIDDVARSWVDRGVFTPAWGVDPEIVEFAIAFYSRNRPYEAIKSAADVATDRFVSARQ